MMAADNSLGLRNLHNVSGAALVGHPDTSVIDRLQFRSQNLSDASAELDYVASHSSELSNPAMNLDTSLAAETLSHPSLAVKSEDCCSCGWFTEC
jgi:hypothetical protein